MSTPFDAIEFGSYLRARWRIWAGACASAFLLALGISLLLPKRYTATVVLSIDPPAGNDVRITTAVSPVYLESLKGYERFASSDELFARTAEHFRLRAADSGEPLEAIKRRVLKVTKPRDTRILEISATLENPQQAHSVAMYIADQAVAMNRSENAGAEHDLIEAAERQQADAQQRLAAASQTWTDVSARGAIDYLQNRNDADIELLNKLRQQLSDLNSDSAEYVDREQSLAKEGNAADASELRIAREQARSATVRAGAIRTEIDRLEKELAREGDSLASARAKRDAAETELRVAQSAVEAISSRVRDLKTGAAAAGERLRIIDPGIVPQRPSSPRVQLNLVVAVLFAALASLVWLTVSFGFRSRNLDRVTPSYQRRY